MLNYYFVHVQSIATLRYTASSSGVEGPPRVPTAGMLLSNVLLLIPLHACVTKVGFSLAMGKQM